jgi:hypothetical protein
MTIRSRIAVFALLLAFSAMLAQAEDKPATEADAKAAFESAFKSGKEAVLAKDWPKATEQLQQALRSLGTYEHDDKAIAQILLEKAQASLKAQGGTEPKVEPKKESAEAPKKEPAKEAVAEQTALEIPNPRSLSEGDWMKGPGSSCYWAGDLLYLEEGDEYFKKVLKKDFALAVKVEALMDEQSRINIELRAPRDSGDKIKVTGWGSKAGSAPFLEVDGEKKGKGQGRPKSEIITMAFVRTGKKIDYYCNDTLIGSTTEAKAEQPFNIWVSGKGRVMGFKLTER